MNFNLLHFKPYFPYLHFTYLHIILFVTLHSNKLIHSILIFIRFPFFSVFFLTFPLLFHDTKLFFLVVMPLHTTSLQSTSLYYSPPLLFTLTLISFIFHYYCPPLLSPSLLIYIVSHFASFHFAFFCFPVSFHSSVITFCFIVLYFSSLFNFPTLLYI